MPTPCNAPPGWFCSPLYHRPTICPENWYCPGGETAARKCPDGRWSAVNSVYAEDCLDHMDVDMTVLFVLFCALLVVFVCIWYSAWDAKSRKKSAYPDGAPVHVFHGTPYGTTSLYPI